VAVFELLAAARVAARRHGYALAIHGSLSRDLDLVAIPWVVKAATNEDLVEAVREAVHGCIFVGPLHPMAGKPGWEVHPNRQVGGNPSVRPHGRYAWSIHLLGTGTYLDLSVMPL
jgi:hypothetical protein